jgi:hypothetical protein
MALHFTPKLQILYKSMTYAKNRLQKTAFLLLGVKVGLGDFGSVSRKMRGSDAQAGVQTKLI